MTDLKTRLIDALESAKENAHELLYAVQILEMYPRYKRQADGYRAEIKNIDELIAELKCQTTE